MFAAYCYVIFLLTQCKNIQSAATSGDITASSASIAKLTVDMGKCFSGDQSTFYSAMSLSSALQMLYVGAGKSSAFELTNSLNLSTFSVEDVQKYYAETIQAGGSYTLELVNRLFAQTGFSILQTYLDSLQNNFLAPLERYDFKGDPIGGAKRINTVVDNVTHGLINKLYDENAFVGAEPKIIMLNAIYFRGDWVYKFSPELTTTREFTTLNGGRSPTQFMTQIANIKYTEVPRFNSKAVQLDYQGGHVSMTIILPDDTAGLPKFLDRINKHDLNWLVNESAFNKTEVELIIPKFTIEAKYEQQLSDCLKHLGMPSVFSESQADLSGITTSMRLAVSHIIQKSYVSVSEEGTEAAVVSAVCTGRVCVESLPHYTKFNANHPFFFFISHNILKAILFSGTFVKPSI